MTAEVASQCEHRTEVLCLIIERVRDVVSERDSIQGIQQLIADVAAGLQ
jgi:hypothetical protein